MYCPCHLIQACTTKAVDNAVGGRIGTASDRLALLCAHFDPRAGLHSDAVLLGMRVAGLATLAVLAAFAWRRRRIR